MIGIICAVEQEFTPFLENSTVISQRKIAGLNFMCVSLENTELVMVRSGMGKVNASIAAQCMIENFQVSTIIVSGVNGSIDKNLKLFDLTVCKKCTHHDLPMDIIIRDYPKIESPWFYTDSKLLEIATKADEKIKQIVMLTGEKFIDVDGREELISRFSNEGLLAVDMETAAVAQTALANDVSFLCIRSISDTEEEAGLDVFWQNVAKASYVSYTVCKKIIRILN